MTREDRLGNSFSLTFPEWVPPAVIEAANQLNDELAKEKDPTKAVQVLSRLVSDPLMKRVWQEVYRRKRIRHQSSEEYLNPASTNVSRTAAFPRQASDFRERGGEENVHNAELLEAEAAIIESESDPIFYPPWSAQDRAAQLLLRQAYRTALDNTPVYLSHLEAKTNDLRKIATWYTCEHNQCRFRQKRRDGRKSSRVAPDPPHGISPLMEGVRRSYGVRTSTDFEAFFDSMAAVRNGI